VPLRVVVAMRLQLQKRANQRSTPSTSPPVGFPSGLWCENSRVGAGKNTVPECDAELNLPGVAAAKEKARRCRALF